MNLLDSSTDWIQVLIEFKYLIQIQVWIYLKRWQYINNQQNIKQYDFHIILIEITRFSV